MLSSVRAEAAAGHLARWRGLRSAALTPAARPWQRRATCQVVAAVTGPPQPQPGSPALFESAAQQRRRRDWAVSQQELAAFQQAHGRLPRQNGSTLLPLAEGERRLAQWRTHQRRRKEGSAGSPLSGDERAALEVIPGWQWLAQRRPERLPLDTRRRQVAVFVEQHGRLPRHSVSPASPLPPLPLENALGSWCGTQRQRYKGNLRYGTELSREQAAALEAIPGWYWEEYTLLPWEQWRVQVAAFQQQHGQLPRTQISPTSPTPPLERELGTWCNRQRQRWKGKAKPALAAEEVAALEAIPGWYWEEQLPWEERLAQVAAFQQQQGRLPRCEGSERSPLIEGEQQLGGWCHTQRQWRKGNVLRGSELTDAQVAALEAIPGWVWDVAEAWQQRLQQVVAFQQQHGRVLRQQGGKQSPLLEGERELGQWCGTQRQRRKGNSKHDSALTGEQAAALEAIPGWFWEEFTVQPWDERRAQVAAFQQQHGRLPRCRGGKRGPLAEGEGELGVWCNLQRQRRKGNRGAGSELTDAQQAALEAIPGWFWEEGEVWQRRLQQLVDFVAEHGRLPRQRGSSGSERLEGEHELAGWCTTQRQRRKGRKVTGSGMQVAQQAALEAVPGWWWDEGEAWRRWLQQLAPFVAEQGRLPRKRGNNNSERLEGEHELATWCTRQRLWHKGMISTKATITAEQVASLEAIPGWFW